MAAARGPRHLLGRARFGNGHLNERRIDPDDLIKLRRVIYQSMQLAFHRGRLVPDLVGRRFEIGPTRLDSQGQRRLRAGHGGGRKKPGAHQDGHRNFLRDAVYFPSPTPACREAAQWYRYLSDHYPDKIILDGQTNSFPRNLTLAEYCIGRVAGDVGETDRNRIKQTVEGMLERSFHFLIMDEDEQSLGQRNLAEQVYNRYMDKIKGREMAIGLAPFPVNPPGCVGAFAGYGGVLPNPYRDSAHQIEFGAGNRRPRPPPTNAAAPRGRRARPMSRAAAG
jgi:hypothetical protein